MMSDQKRKNRNSAKGNRWTKENVGYCTFLLLKNGDHSSAVKSSNPSSPTFNNEDRPRVERKTKRKVHATKEYINQNRRELWVYLYHRELRRESMEAEIAKQQLSLEEAQSVRNSHFEKESQYLRVRRARTSLKEFTILARLGKGGYGQVFLCRKVDTGEILALKQMKKSRFTDKNEVHRVKKEREVMTKTNSPWLARLKYCFQSQNYLYMAMEYIPGGDLKTLLDHMGIVAELDARFLFAEMLLAVDALHQLGYIHRDLKPDNFMIDRTGHLKLIDFGLSKEGFTAKLSSTRTLKRRESSFRMSLWSKNNTALIPQTTKGRNKHRKVFSVVGSPEYMAIEILNQEGYNHLVDYWSLGVILFEFLFGFTPFGADTVSGVFENVKNWKERVVRPQYDDDDDEEEQEEVSEAAWDLVSKLITSADQRLGKQGLKEVQSHPWFSNFDWNSIREMEPPFIPNLENENDTSYFPADNPISQAGLHELEADLDHLISKQLAKASDRGSIEAVYSHKEEKSKDYGKSVEAYLQEREQRRMKTDDGILPSSSSADVREQPKLKFNQSCSKFDFAGFTFKHEDFSVLDGGNSPRENDPPTRERSNSTVERENTTITRSEADVTSPKEIHGSRIKIAGRSSSGVSNNSHSSELHTAIDQQFSSSPGSDSSQLFGSGFHQIGTEGPGSTKINQVTSTQSPSLVPASMLNKQNQTIREGTRSAGPKVHSTPSEFDMPQTRLGRTNTVQVIELKDKPIFDGIRHADSQPLHSSSKERKQKESDLDSLKKRVAKLGSSSKSRKGSFNEDASERSDQIHLTHSQSSTASPVGSGQIPDIDSKDGEDKKSKKKDKSKRSSRTLRGFFEAFSSSKHSESHIVVSTKNKSSSSVSPRTAPTSAPLSPSNSQMNSSIYHSGSQHNDPPVRQRSGTVGDVYEGATDSDLISVIQSKLSHRHRSEGRSSRSRSGQSPGLRHGVLNDSRSQLTDLYSHSNPDSSSDISRHHSSSDRKAAETTAANSQQDNSGSGYGLSEPMTAKERVLALAKAYRESQASQSLGAGVLSGAGIHSATSSGRSSPIRSVSPLRSQDDAGSPSNSILGLFDTDSKGGSSRRGSEKRKRRSDSPHESRQTRRLSSKLSLDSDTAASPNDLELDNPSPMKLLRKQFQNYSPQSSSNLGSSIDAPEFRDISDLKKLRRKSDNPKRSPSPSARLSARFDQDAISSFADDEDNHKSKRAEKRKSPSKILITDSKISPRESSSSSKSLKDSRDKSSPIRESSKKSLKDSQPKESLPVSNSSSSSSSLKDLPKTISKSLIGSKKDKKDKSK